MSVLAQSDTHWRIARAEKLRIIIDAADYFRAAKAAMLLARHSIMLIGWDFDTRIPLEPAGATLEGPNELGDFLKFLPERQEGLRIYMLKWDIGMLQGIERGMLPVIITDLLTSSELSFKLDTVHPTGAAHHSKIVVIDDRFAFCGGIDMTDERWDTPAHEDDEPHRVTVGGEPAKPWHDATIAVSGPIAGALGDLARERWRRATGDTLEPPAAGDPIWPDHLTPNLTDVPVAIARTFPEFDGYPEVREIEAFYLAAFASAERTLYIESQYLASQRLTEALAARLAEPDGPEIVIVLPQNAEGWLRRKAMDGARHHMLRLLWDADVHGRFGAYYPVTAGGGAIYVHAKVLVLDDRALRVGSSNLNNRSMGFDTETDLIIDAEHEGSDSEAVRAAILDVRDGLVCEHLGIEREALHAAMTEADGSLRGAIEALRGDGRSLRPFTPEAVAGEDSVLTENAFADPEAAETLGDRLVGGVTDLVRRAADQSS